MATDKLNLNCDCCLPSTTVCPQLLHDGDYDYDYDCMPAL